MRLFRGLLLLFCSTGGSFAEEPKAIANSIGIRLISIPAGEFAMGSPPTEPGRRDRETRTQVVLRSFYLGQFEVTQSQYEEVMGDRPSAFAASGPQAAAVEGLDTADFPVDSATWFQAVEFCERLSQSEPEKQAGRRYRLPTEAEWEYACRAGTTGPFAFGDDATRLGDYAWIAANSGGRPHPVGEKLPNAWGLHDLYGNVWEWCADRYADDYSQPAALSFFVRPFFDDPLDQAAPTFRVIRGGGYASDVPARMRSAARNFDPPAVADADVGFRVVMETADD
jgi:formylglycine-generating enzyme required for sulfatase activity